MVHFFDSDIAKKYGVNAAVLACFLRDCIEQKSTESPQLHEGKAWVRCSVQMMTGFSPFLSYDEIQYIFRGKVAVCYKISLKYFSRLRNPASIERVIRLLCVPSALAISALLMPRKKCA